MHADGLTTSAAPFGLAQEGVANWRRFQEILTDSPGLRLISGYEERFRLRGADSGENMYTYFPALFEPADSRLREQAKQELSVAALFLLCHSIVVDRLIDGDKGMAQGPPPLLACGGCLASAWLRLEFADSDRLLPWPEIVAVYDRYTESLLAEYRALKKGSFEASTIRRLIGGKSLLATIIPLAVSHLCGRPERAAALCGSVEEFHIASNMWDDLMDWRTDFQNGRITYLLSEPVRNLFGSNALYSKENETVLRDAIYSGGQLEEYLTETLSWLDTAHRHARDSHWGACVLRAREEISSRADHILSLARHMKLGDALKAGG